jgi:hypothetical protein
MFVERHRKRSSLCRSEMPSLLCCNCDVRTFHSYGVRYLAHSLFYKTSHSYGVTIGGPLMALRVALLSSHSG